MLYNLKKLILLKGKNSKLSKNITIIQLFSLLVFKKIGKAETLQMHENQSSII